MMKVILVLLDACRYDYISKESTPFLWKCAQEGNYIERIIPSAGFCERTEIFTGKTPKESGFFTAIGFDPQKSPYRNNRFLSLLGCIELKCTSIFNSCFPSKKYTLIKYHRKILIIFYHFFKKNKYGLKFYNIPLSFIKYFNLTEDEYDFFDENFKFFKETIFYQVKNRNEETYFNSFTSLNKSSVNSDIERLQYARTASNNISNSFIPIYIGMLDSVGHKYGPESKELLVEFKKLDDKLKEFVEYFNETNPGTSFIFLGDHGMTEVTSIIDVKNHIESIIKKYKIKPGKDILYFLDSTLLRIWFLNEKTNLTLKKIIDNDKFLLENGIFITESLAQKYKIPYNDRRYGDIAWWCNDGTLIFPDFFHNNYSYKGMHGYRPENPSNHGTCIIWGTNISSSYKKEMNLNLIYDTLNELLYY